MSTSYDHLITLLLCGDRGVGKTSMLRRYVSDDSEMNDGYIATVGKYLATTQVLDIIRNKVNRGTCG